MFDLIKVGQLRGSSNGPLGLQTAHDSIHQQHIGQSLSHVLWVLETQNELTVADIIVQEVQCG